MQTVQSKSYELPLARAYVRHWGITEAVRELLRVAFNELLQLADKWSAK